MIQLLVIISSTWQGRLSQSTQIIDCVDREHASMVRNSLQHWNGEGGNHHFTVIELPAPTDAKDRLHRDHDDRYLGIDSAHQVGPFTIPMNPLKEPLIAGVPFVHFVRAIEALRYRAEAVVNSQGGKTTDDLPDWESAQAIETLINECKDRAKQFR
jgi:hypothetical protein